MDSSTSHFKRRVPRLLVVLAACAVVTWILAALYCTHLNPEVRCYREIYFLKKAWADQLSATNAAKVVFYGGSSCDFGIDGQRMTEKHHMPAVNMGLAAGIGPLVLTRAALSVTRPGDTLVISLEPDLLSEPAEPSTFGAQFAWSTGHRDWLQVFPGHTPYAPARSVIDLRPGGRYTFTILGKWLRRQPLYRYSPSEVNPGGLHETPVRYPLSAILEPKPLSADGRALLAGLRDWAAQNRVQLYYALPRAWVPSDDEQRMRAVNAKWLLAVAEIVPVLRDPLLGIDSDASHYADIGWHLNRTGAELRTDALTEALKQRQTWTLAELQQMAQR